MTLDQIAEHMGFNEETAKKNVQSLMTPTMKILTQKDNKFSVNLEFKSPKKRIMFPIPILEPVVKQKKINQDRTHAVDAAIVKIMKSRIKSSFVDLRNKVIMLM
jgi:cullin 1